MKTQGAWLAQREAEQALIWGRPSSTLPPLEDVPLEDLSVHWLERTLKRLIEEQQRLRPRQVEPNPPSVLERMTEILSLLRDTWSLLFSSHDGRRAQALGGRGDACWPCSSSAGRARSARSRPSSSATS